MKDDATRDEVKPSEGEAEAQPETNGQSPETSTASPEVDPLEWSQDEALRDLVALARERSKLEKKIHEEFTAKTDVIDKNYKQSSAKAKQQHDDSKSAALEVFAASEKEITEEYDNDYNSNEQEYSTTRNNAISEYETAEETAAKLKQETQWEATTVFEATKKGPTQRLAELKKRIANHKAHFGQFENETRDLLDEYKMSSVLGEISEQPREVEEGQDVFKVLQELVQESHSLLLQLNDLGSAKLFTRGRWLWLFIVPFVLGAVGGGFALGWSNFALWLGAGGGAAVVVGALLWFVLRMRAKKNVGEICEAFEECLAEGAYISRQCVSAAEERAAKEIAETERKRDAQTVRAEKQYQVTHKEITTKREKTLAAATEKHEPLRKKFKLRRDKKLAEATKIRDSKLEEAKELFDKQTAEMESRYKTNKGKVDEWHEANWSKMAERWKQQVTEFHAARERLTALSDPLFPPFDPENWKRWETPSEIPPVVQYGKFDIDMNEIEGGVPLDESLQKIGPEKFELPALLPFPQHCSLLFESNEDGFQAATDAMQGMMLRLFTAIPPAKCRFTIIDPVGLGENFAAFMTLADYDEALVAARIWTETQHIEQRLADLSETIENVIQKYLRNEFETIDAYNDYAGEVAEPFRILVVANFPTNFNENAAKRLVSLAGRGPRCGIYTLVLCDTRQKLPQGVEMEDLEQHATVLEWRDDRYVLNHPIYKDYPLRLEGPPEPEQFKAILQDAGQKAKLAKRVEVPFEMVAPPESEWWKGDSRRDVDVPLGRAGATKNQHMVLGHGTSQHVLMAGKTGSGKSTLLHVLITNLALKYSPDEVQFYLIDFKKGVEFKHYAKLKLPHARAVAIESEREFGLSVMQSLDGEMKRRGDLFRSLGLQDVHAYRNLETGTPMPRILLLVDEFQELFVEDDKISQDAAVLLDRLVRQGRAFGIHVMLGSQSLGGANSLPRATLGQMAVRVAMQCSESDAQLILSDENSAARLLSRPGEAIYNDANGLFEGNHPFQVVWLSDEKREKYLNRVLEMGREMGYKPPDDQVVFEGNEPAVISDCSPLCEVIEESDWSDAVKAPQVWLGDAVTIKPPTAAIFRRQGGANMFIVGQAEESALGVMASTMLSLGSQYAPLGSGPPSATAQFCLLDGTPDDSEQAGELAKVAAALPHNVTVVPRIQTAEMLGDISEEVNRRLADSDTQSPAIFVLIHDLARFRDLRTKEDDWGFSSSDDEDKTTPPDKLLGNILREGPGLGVHVIVWCDTATNLGRTFDRATLREFDIRVLFQMSPADSTNLIDTPIANKLGHNRGLIFNEEQGSMEKFRPFDFPPQQWLDETKATLVAKKPSSIAQN